jgi:hypothetical protein
MSASGAPGALACGACARARWPCAHAAPVASARGQRMCLQPSRGSARAPSGGQMRRAVCLRRAALARGQKAVAARAAARASAAQIRGCYARCARPQLKHPPRCQRPEADCSDQSKRAVRAPGLPNLRVTWQHPASLSHRSGTSTERGRAQPAACVRVRSYLRRRRNARQLIDDARKATTAQGSHNPSIDRPMLTQELQARRCFPGARTARWCS